MSSKKTEDLPLSGSATGAELVHVAKPDGDGGYDSRAMTTAELAALAIGDGATAELIRDIIGAALTAGAGISISVDDAGNTISISCSIDAEYIRDTIGAALAATTGLTINVDDAGNTIGFSVSFASSAEVRAGTANNKAITPEALVSAAAFQTLTDQAAIDWNLANGFNAKVTLGAVGRTMNAPTNPKEGVTYSLLVIQDGTGSRTITSWNAAFDWGSAGAPTLSTAAGKKDLVTLLCIDAAAPTFRASFSKAS